MIPGGLLLVGALISSSLTGPFSMGGETWCPSYQAQYGCTTTQHPSQYSVRFAASQVSLSGSTVDLSMNSTAGVSGAFDDNGYTSQYISNDEQVWADVNVSCNSSGLVENWPAFWLDGSTGSWPTHGEIDISEGLSGHTWWHYWFTNSSGQKQDVGAEYTGSDCGSQWYSVNRTPGKLSFFKDSVLMGTVSYDAQATSSSCDGNACVVNVPLASDPMYPIFDYAAGEWGGPTTNDTVMTVSGYGTHSG